MNIIAMIMGIAPWGIILPFRIGISIQIIGLVWLIAGL